MKTLFMAAFMLIGFSSFNSSDTVSLYDQGYQTGQSIARDCNNLNRVQVFKNTVNGDFPSITKMVFEMVITTM